MINLSTRLRHRFVVAVYRDLTKIIRVRHYRRFGYKTVTSRTFYPRNKLNYVESTSAYSLKEGLYLGDPRSARYLTKQRGIREFYLRTLKSNIATIGYDPNNRIWYGWSHRAIAGFEIGDRIFEKRYGDDTTPFKKHGSRTIKTLEQAKLSAKRFAASVS